MAIPNDAARRWTDAELGALERRMTREYSQAAKDMRGKQAEWLEKFNREREQREKALDDTKEAMEAHKRWLQSQAARGDWLDGMATQLAESAHHANVRAMDMVNGHIPHVFAENANRAGFSVDKMLKADTGFTLVNEDAVRHVMEAGVFDAQLIREVVPDAPELGPAAIQSLRKREVDYPKDMRWNRQKFTSAITQGILQGESIPNIVKRTESIYGQNRNAAIRAARTATTNAENAGRMNSFERAQRLGIDMEIEWEATLDGRPRSSHRDLDGQRIQLGEHFESEHGPIRWPGDPQAHPAEVWCCRCRADGRVVGFDGKRGGWADEAGERWSRLPKGMTYEQWKAGKAVSRAESYGNEAGRVSGAWYAERAAEVLSAPQANGFAGMIDGRDITAEIADGAGMDDFEINDVIKAQGFDGVPRVVEADEFGKLAAEASDGGLIMQRAYGAPTQEVLDSYRQALYGGDFYVDCSGGHRYGRGMYASWAEGTEPTRSMQKTSERYAKSHGANVGYIETMTLDKSARVISYEDLMKQWDNEAIPKRLREGDDGVLAAALGFDAIRVDGTGEMVVLNRTKLIIRRPE